MDEDNTQVGNQGDSMPTSSKGFSKTAIIIVSVVVVLVILGLVFAIFIGNNGKRNNFNIPFLSNDENNSSDMVDSGENLQNIDGEDDNSSSYSDNSGESSFNPVADEKTGYTILWKDPLDDVGRTILYDNNKNTTAPQLLAGRMNGVGRVYDEKSGKISYTAGIFEKFEESSRLNKINIILKNPLSNELLTQIELDLSELGTRIYVEDVDYGPRNPIPDYLAEAEQYGLLFQIYNKSDYLKKGDAVIVLPERLNSNDSIGSGLVLRRYGGKLKFTE